jgi:SPP1 family predicted phage head-tail adaptor
MSGPIRIGDLNRRLVLQAPVEADDGAGGVTRSFTTVAAVWAQVVPQSARADVAADSRGAALRYRITIRARNDVTTQHQLLDGTTIYRVIAASLSADRRFLVLDAEVRED